MSDQNKKYPNSYEKVADLFRGSTERLKVPGGWIVQTCVMFGGSVSVHQIFLSDPNHEWELE